MELYNQIFFNVKATKLIWESCLKKRSRPNWSNFRVKTFVAYIEEQFRAVVGPNGGGAVERSPLHQVPVLHVGVVLEQDLGDLAAFVHAGEVQRRVGVLVLVVNR